MLLNFSKAQNTTGMTLSSAATAISAWYATKYGRTHRFTTHQTSCLVVSVVMNLCSQ
jgi:hypothetical protein